MNKKIRQNLFPVLAALIWGTAFVAQSVGSEYVPPLTFGAIRCSMAFAALALGLWIVRMVQKKKAPEKVEPLASSPKDLVLGGISASPSHSYSLQYPTAKHAPNWYRLMRVCVRTGHRAVAPNNHLCAD